MFHQRQPATGIRNWGINSFTFHVVHILDGRHGTKQALVLSRTPSISPASRAQFSSIDVGFSPNDVIRK
ncbi:Unknown protein sequence [Pseudomonas savastanoi pv. phaseolicola]|nr:Unknown protein sequence [Pseudomonas savastanoi pv. phaseolicola]KPB60580.1 Unknown protein sequence [Pseudomonas amygdali pv. mellea]